MESDFTSDFTDLKTCIIVIRNVPCYKCVQCGEIAFDFSVGERIEEIIESYKNAITQVAIINYSEKAA